MEEDIKIVERLIEAFRKDNRVIFTNVGLRKSIEFKAIENLLQENKTSKETINILTNKLEQVVDDNNELRKYYASRKEVEDLKETIACLHESSKEMFIPISVIQNKIDWYKAYEGTVMYKKYNYEEIIQTLQKLLEEGKK